MTDQNNPYPLHSAAASGLKGNVVVPGDKSISHRALMLSSQVLGITRISGLLEGDDVLNTAKALQSLGVNIIPPPTGGRLGGGHNLTPSQISPHPNPPPEREGIWSVEGVGIGGLVQSTDVLDLGNSGTSTRLLMGLVTPYPFTTFFTGDDSLSSRPMGRVMTPLQQMGAKITARDGNKLPLAVEGTADTMPIAYKLPVASAQVKSAILLAGLNTAGKTTVIEPAPTRDHTENMLRFFGFKVDSKKLKSGALEISLQGQQKTKYADRKISVPGDPSSAAFLIVAALICPNAKLTIKNVCINPLRTGLFTTLKAMKAKIVFKNKREVAGEKVADIVVASSKLKGVVVPAGRAPSMIDEYPILAVAAAFAKGKTVMHGLSELRVKESDRLAAIVNGLTACGVKARAEGDTLIVTGGDVAGGATIKTHYDHRIAMSFLVLGMASQKAVTVDDAAAIKTSFPNFVELMNGIGANIANHSKAQSSNRPLVIAIDGPAASGKGTLARHLAKHFKLDYLDTGSLYRAVAMKVIYAGEDPHDRAAAIAAAKSISADDLVGPRLRQERVGQAASVVSAFPEVRKALLHFQRNFARSKKGAVLDGRDIGTVVCPDADFKFFITATLYARAKRRHKELEEQGTQVEFDSVLADLSERDERDEKRAIAPMKPAEDAILIDTSDMDAPQVFDFACRVILRKYASLTHVDVT